MHMKTNKIINALAAGVLALSVFGCKGEKDLIIIDQSLPIKTDALYMVGSATPNGWNIDNPTPLEPSAEDPLVFAWEGPLLANEGGDPNELKLCLTTGSWDVPFIRPMSNGTPINRKSIVDEVFDMHAGDPDNKWTVTESGIYLLIFDLRNWTMSTEYLRELDPIEVEPIETENFYMVGDATPAGWNIDAPTQLNKESKYIFTWEGQLTRGELKACCTTGSWDVPFVRPSTGGVKISKDGVEDPNFVYLANPDDKWVVADAGKYKLTFDLEHWTIAAEFKGETPISKDPIETDYVFMIGDATPGGWDMAEAQEFTKESHYIFTWEGELVNGEFKCCIVRDNSWSCPFIRPEQNGVVVDANGVANPNFVFTTNPDDKWIVTESGVYKITLDLEHYTIKAEKKGGGGGGLKSDTLYMVGDATPNGWSMDDPTQFTQDSSSENMFTWTGYLNEGEFKACLKPDGTWSCPFLRPPYENCKVCETGVDSPDFIYTAGDPDYKWLVTKAGNYRLVFDLAAMTIYAEYLD